MTTNPISSLPAVYKCVTNNCVTKFLGDLIYKVAKTLHIIKECMQYNSCSNEVKKSYCYFYQDAKELNIDSVNLLLSNNKNSNRATLLERINESVKDVFVATHDFMENSPDTLFTTPSVFGVDAKYQEGPFTVTHFSSGTNCFIRTPLDAVKQEPIAFLHQLATILRDSTWLQFCLEFALLDAQGEQMHGIDEGGLSQQIFTTLFEELKKTILDEDDASPKMLPIKDLPETIGAKELESIYRDIGTVFRWCYDNTPVVGEIFPPSYFKALRLTPLNRKILNDRKLVGIARILSTNTTQTNIVNFFEKMASRSDIQEKDYQEIATDLTIGYDELWCLDWGIKPHFTQEDKEALKLAAKKYCQNIVEPVFIIKQQLHKPDEIIPSAKELEKNIQGAFDKQKLLDKICPDNTCNDSDVRCYDWLAEWMQKEETTEEILRNFLFQATGAKVTPKESFLVRATFAQQFNEVFRFHTCPDRETKNYKFDVNLTFFADNMAGSSQPSKEQFFDHLYQECDGKLFHAFNIG